MNASTCNGCIDANALSPGALCVPCVEAAAREARLREQFDLGRAAGRAEARKPITDGFNLSVSWDQFEKLRQERDALRSVLSDIAEGDCGYGDGCPVFGSRHGTCTPCVARRALVECSTPSVGVAPKAKT